MVPGDLRQADLPSWEFGSGHAIWNWSGKAGTVILLRPGFLFRDIP